MNANAPHSEIDHNIDRALTAFRDAQPRSGLDGRILAALEKRADEMGGLPFHAVKGWGIVCGSKRESTPRLSHLALWAATSAAILAIASLAILHHSGGPTSTRTAPQGGVAIATSATSSSRPNPNPAPFPTTNLARTSAEPTHRMAHLATTTMPAPCAHSGCPVHDDGGAVGMNGISQTPTDAQLLADLHAPSHPAPPLPMTAQEKLFRRMLQYGNATQLAELDPVVRAKENADETTAFKAFFPDPPPLKQPGDNE